MTATELAFLIVLILMMTAAALGVWISRPQRRTTGPYEASEPAEAGQTEAGKHQESPVEPSGNAAMAELLARGIGAGKVEPKSVQRAAARELYAMYASFIDAGYTREQALDLQKHILAADIQRGKG